MSQDQNELEKTFFKNGELQTEGLVIAGKKHGEWRHYFQTGVLRVLMNFHHGIEHGKSYWFHSNGNLGWEEFYIGGIPEGKFSYYDEKGQLRIEKVYENGIEVSYIFDGKEMKKN
jgi:antitoxin component YwqK of YwqJK toxin-antitoxin module